MKNEVFTKQELEAIGQEITDRLLSEIFCQTNFSQSYEVWKNDVKIESDRNQILDTYIHESELIDYSKLTPWLRTTKKAKKSRTTNYLVLESLEYLNKLSWKIDENNRERIKPKKVENGQVLENEEYVKIESEINKFISIYVKLASQSKKLYEKGYRFEYRQTEKSVCIIHSNGSLCQYITNDLYDNLESFIDSLEQSKKKVVLREKKHSYTVLSDKEYEESLIRMEQEKESLKESLKAYNKYAFYKLSKNTNRSYEISDNNDLLYFFSESSILPDEIIGESSIEYDFDLIDGSMIAKKGSHFLPIYVIPEKEERELPIDEQEIKVTYKNGSTVMKSSTDFKVKKSETVLQKTLSEKQKLVLEANKLLKTA